MKRSALILAACMLFVLHSFAQRVCGTANYNNAVLKKYPMLEGRLGRNNTDQLLRQKLKSLTGVINIPVSIHIIYKMNEERLPQSLLQAQIDEVNRDFSGNSNDISNVPSCFKTIEADCGIHFEIAKLTYKKTSTDTFLEQGRPGNVDDPLSDPIKFDNQGGQNGDASTQYLNIWIGSISNGSNEQLLGYGTYPGGIGKYDGVVIFYKAIGPNNILPRFDQGKTLTHELGHWLNLRHIWGDDNCGNDLIDDTPTQETYSAGLPQFPHISCNNSPNGDMFMNFMDYTDDEGMFMFTLGQRDRMRALFVEGGVRSSFIRAPAANNLATETRAMRNDANTPVLSYIKDYLKGATKQAQGKIISWTPAQNVKKYIFQSRLVGSENWLTTVTKENSVLLNTLKSGALYEIRVKSVDATGIASAQSTPYIFKNNSKKPTTITKQ